MQPFNRVKPAAVWWMIVCWPLAAGASATERPKKQEPTKPVVEVTQEKPAVKPAPAPQPALSPHPGRSERKPPGNRPQVHRDDHPVGGTAVLRLKHSSAQAAVGHLKRLFRGSRRVRASADEFTNVLLVRAEPELLDQVRHIVDVLEDTAAEHARRSAWSVRVFHLEHTDAERVRKLVMNLSPFARRDSPPRVQCDRRTNSLLINAVQDDWQEIETIIRAVDVPGE